MSQQERDEREKVQDNKAYERFEEWQTKKIEDNEDKLAHLFGAGKEDKDNQEKEAEEKAVREEEERKKAIEKARFDKTWLGYYK